MSTEDAVPEDPSPEDPSPEDPSPEDPSPVDAAPVDAAPVVPAADVPAPDPWPDARPLPVETDPAGAADVPATPGRRGRYRIGELLGRGGASAVHRGWDRLLHRPVAVKVLTYDIQPAPDERHREARVVAGLDHPGLVPVYDVSRLDGRDAVVMALVDGPSLADHLRDQGPLPLRDTLRLGAEVADGLAHVHAHGIVHRDVKPANILLASSGARLTDFGIARAPGTTTLTGGGNILGTAAYLAPEQVRSGEATPAVDVFALGLVLLECLTAQPCYPSSPAECAERLGVAPTVPDGLPDAAREIVSALTSLDADRRPTASEAGSRLRTMADLLAEGGERALGGEAVVVAHGRRLPVPFATAVVGLLMVAAAVTAVLTLVHGRPDIAVPVLVAAVAAQGAVLWTGRRSGARPRRDGPPDDASGGAAPRSRRERGGHPPAPAGP